MRTYSFARLAGVLVVLWLALNLPLLLGLRVLPGDATYEFFPMMFYNVHALRTGELPWWNPLIFGGYPQISDPQAMLFAPLMMGWMLLQSSPSMAWFVAGTLIHVLLGGLAMLALLRRLQCTPLGALIGSLVFMAGGVAASRIQYVPIVIVYSLIPVALLCLWRLGERPTWPRSLLTGLVAGAILVEPVQLTYFLGILLPTFALALAMRRWPAWSWTERRLYVGGLAVAGLLALAIATPQLLLSWAFVSISNRPQLPLSAATDMSVSGSTFLTYLLPNALHNLRGTYSGPVDPIETFYWIGALPSLLLVIGWRRAWAVPTQRRFLLFFLVVAVLAIAYMLGGHTPFYGWAYHLLPGVKQFRRPSDAAYLVNIGLAFAVGFAASHIDPAHRRQWLWILGIAAAWLLLASLGMRGAPDSWQAATLVAPLVAVGAWWYMRDKRNARTATWCALILVVVDVRCFALNGEFNQRGNGPAKFVASPAVAFVTDRLRQDASAGHFHRIEATDFASWKNNVVLKGLPATQGYGPLRWSLWDRWYGAYSDGDGPRPVSPYSPNPGSHLNTLLGVRYVVHAPAGATTGWMHPPAEVLYADKDTEVLSMPDAYDRFLTPATAIVRSADQPPSPAEFEATDFRKTVWLTPRPGQDARQTASAGEACEGGEASLSAAVVRNTHLQVHKEGERAAWVVVNDPDFPGWIASIDGAPVAVHRANGMFRAVCVPAGAHTLAFDFKPWDMVREVATHPEAWR